MLLSLLRKATAGWACLDQHAIVSACTRRALLRVLFFPRSSLVDCRSNRNDFSANIQVAKLHIQPA